MLKVENIRTYYGQVEVLRGISLSVEHEETVTIIGANGAGKTTLLRTIMGIIPNRMGRIIFEDMDITNMGAEKIIPLGIAMVPEGREIFTNLTVFENLLLGGYYRLRRGKRGREEIEGDFQLVYSIFPVLKERKNQLGGTLSGGEQQMLSVGRALMSKPRLMLLDEPSLGLAPFLCREIFKSIDTLRKSGMTILLIEQNSKLALGFSNRCYIMRTGNIIYEGNSGDLIEKSEELKKYYLK
jgi:branched-chain amino acid transport system ATP-binding protein